MVVKKFLKGHNQGSEKITRITERKNIQKMMLEEIELTISAKLNENNEIMFGGTTSDIFDLMDEKYPDMPIETQISLLESSRLFPSLI